MCIKKALPPLGSGGKTVGIYHSGLPADKKIVSLRGEFCDLRHTCCLVKRHFPLQGTPPVRR